MYLVLTKIGLIFALKAPTITIFWPAGGLALAALLICGTRALPAIFIGGVIAGMIAVPHPGVALFLGMADAGESLFCYWFLTRIADFDPALSRRQDFFLLTLLAGGLGSALSALIGPSALLIGNVIDWEIYPQVVLRWWMGNVLGIAFMAPLILIWRTPVRHRTETTWLLELGALFIATFFCGQMLFFDWFNGWLDNTPSIAWLIPLVIWAGLRAGRHATVVLQLMIFIQALFSASQGHGVYANDMINNGLINFWLFGMVVAIGGMALAEIAGERECAQEALEASERHARENNERLQLALSVARQGWFDLNLQTGEIQVSPEYPKLLGYDPADFRSTLEKWQKNIHPADQGPMHAAFSECLVTGGPVTMEYRRMCKNGEWLWISSTGKIAAYDMRGKPARMIGIHTDITERKMLELELTRQAHIDYLTGVSSRRFFMEQAEQELSRAVRYGNFLSVLMLDLDHFKRINDTYGHKIGDSVLKMLAQICRENLRDVDIVGRIGGEEFAVLLPETNCEAALEAGERLRGAIASKKLPLDGGLPLRMTVSIGVTTLTSTEDNMDALLNRADKALYEAKTGGRNQVCLVDA